MHLNLSVHNKRATSGGGGRKKAPLSNTHGNANSPRWPFHRYTAPSVQGKHYLSTVIVRIAWTKTRSLNPLPPPSSLLSRTRTDLDTHRSSLFYETIQKCVTGRFAFILAPGEPWVFDYCPRRPANLIVIPVARRPRFSKSLLPSLPPPRWKL